MLTKSLLLGRSSLIIPSKKAILGGSSPITLRCSKMLNTSKPERIVSRCPPGISSLQTCIKLRRFAWSNSLLRSFRRILNSLILETIVGYRQCIECKLWTIMNSLPSFKYWELNCTNTPFPSLASKPCFTSICLSFISGCFPTNRNIIRFFPSFGFCSFLDVI